VNRARQWRCCERCPLTYLCSGSGGRSRTDSRSAKPGLATSSLTVGEGPVGPVAEEFLPCRGREVVATARIPRSTERHDSGTISTLDERGPQTGHLNETLQVCSARQMDLRRASGPPVPARRLQRRRNAVPSMQSTGKVFPFTDHELRGVANPALIGAAAAAEDRDGVDGILRGRSSSTARDAELQASQKKAG